MSFWTAIQLKWQKRYIQFNSPSWKDCTARPLIHFQFSPTLATMPLTIPNDSSSWVITLTFGYSRSRDGVIREIGVDVYRVAWVCGLEGSWNCYLGTQASRPASSHFNLGALSVELRDPSWPRVVNSKRLNAKEILASRDAGWEIESVCFCFTFSESTWSLLSYLRSRFHVPPGKIGPISRILNHTLPEPSNAAAVVGAWAI